MIGKICCELMMEISNVASEVHDMVQEILKLSAKTDLAPFF